MIFVFLFCLLDWDEKAPYVARNVYSIKALVWNVVNFDENRISFFRGFVYVT